MKARSQLQPSPMNKTEAAWAAELRLAEREGSVLWWAFEPVKLRLGAGCFYTPDFLAMLADGSLRFDEIKGFWRDDARAKIKTAASLYPMFHFRAIQKGRGQAWKIEPIKSHHSEGVWPRTDMH